MATDVVDINKNKRDADKTTALQYHLQAIFLATVEAQNRLNMRIDDLTRDMAKLNMDVEEAIGDLYARFPELEPEEAEEEETE